MAVSLEILEASIDKASEWQQVAEGLIEDLEKYLKESPNKLQEIKNAYLAKVASQQANIISEFPEFHQWSKVKGFLERAETFYKDLEDAVLNPPRAEFLGLFEKWLQSINVSSVPKAEDWLKGCLKGADRVQIAELKDEVVKLTALSKGLEEPVSNQTKTVVKNELAGLTKLDKAAVDNLTMWIENAEEALSQGSSLLKTWSNIKEERADESLAKTPVKEVVEKFDSLVDSTLDRKFVKGEGFDKAMEFWKGTKGDLQKEWTKLKPKFPVIAGQHNELVEHPKSLLVKEVATWEVKKLEEINTLLEGLTKTVGEIIAIKETLEKIEADWSSLEGLSENSKKSELKALVDELVSIRSNAANLFMKLSLREYLQGLNDLSESYNQWLDKLEKLRRQWVEEAKPWIDICKRRGLEILTKLEQELLSLQEFDAELDTIGKITNKRLGLKSTIQEIRDTLRQSLSEQKLQILDKIVELEAEKEEVLIEHLKQKLGQLKLKDLNNVISLSEDDRLLSVRISTRGG